jgi:hypothetical protein
MARIVDIPTGSTGRPMKPLKFATEAFFSGIPSDKDFDLFLSLGCFCPEGFRAVDAQVFVHLPVDQNEEQPFPNRYSRLAPRTVQGRRLELLKISLLCLWMCLSSWS